MPAAVLLATEQVNRTLHTNYRPEEIAAMDPGFWTYFDPVRAGLALLR